MFLFQAVQALGLAIYHAMDYGMGETEERQLSPDLEDLIGHMTEEDEDDDSTCADDEGIEKDAEDEEDRHRQGKHGYCFYDIAQVGVTSNICHTTYGNVSPLSYVHMHPVGIPG